MRSLFPVAAFAALSACSPAIPDSAAGVSALPPARAISDETPALPVVPQGAPAATPAAPPTAPLSALAAPPAATTPLPAAPATADLAAETAAALAATRANSGQTPLRADPGNPPPTVETAAGISEENDFAAVDGVRTIQSDAELIARNRERYEVVQPTALPTRAADTGPNIVAYALATSHAPGTKVFNRIGINKQARFERNCARYASDDLAQEDFLGRGGPDRDRLGLDPDGDGFACGWDPAPFRRAAQG